MKVYIKPKVDAFIKAFYEKAMTDHITLDESTVVAKVNRLYDAIENNLSTFPYKYRKALYRKSWIAAGYRDYSVESFHFAYKVYVNRIIKWRQKKIYLFNEKITFIPLDRSFLSLQLRERKQ